MLLLRPVCYMRKKDECIKGLQCQREELWRGWRKWILEAEAQGFLVRDPDKQPVLSTCFVLEDQFLLPCFVPPSPPVFDKEP